MIITQDNNLKNHIISQLRRKEYSLTQDRGDTIHVSNLIYCLRRTFFKRFSNLSPSFNENSFDVGNLRMLIGLIIEDGITLKTDTQVIKELDDIVGSIDWLPEECPIEIKVTWDREPATPTNHPNWKRQILCYMKMSDCLQAGLGVIHIAGLGGRKPIEEAIPKAYLLSCDQEEIDDNWNWMLNRKEKLIASIKSKEPPSVSTREYDWECSYCGFFNNCVEDLGKLVRENLFGEGAI